MRTIDLTKNNVAIVDSLFYDYLNTFKWFSALGYAVRKRRKSDVPGPLRVYMHHEIFRLQGLSVPKNREVDHINRNRSDNRSENLRIVTRSENVKNSDFTKTRERLQSIAKKKTKRVVNTVTGDLYESTKALCELKGLSRSTLRSKLNGNKVNDTDYIYIKEDCDVRGNSST